MTVNKSVRERVREQLNPNLHEEIVRVSFPNGYTASIIRTQYSYGGDEGLYEVAILDAEDKLDYTTPITDDVVGYLTVDKVVKLCEDIALLDAPTKETPNPNGE
jgi:hypothetical protein